MSRRTGEKNAVSIALTYAGCMLGAGFVSGQEIWQYFGAYGKSGILSLILSFVLLAAATLLLVVLSRKLGKTAMDELILKADLPAVKNLLGDLTAVIIFCNVFIMVAGIGALAEELTGLPAPAVNLAVTALIGLCSYFGIGGMMTVFDLLVPLLVASTLVICGVRLGGAGPAGVRFTQSAAVNPMLGGCAPASVNYAAMNFFGVITVFPPIGQKIAKGRTMVFALILGTVLLIFSGLGIVLALCTAPEAVRSEIPMQTMALTLGRTPGVMIAFMLFAAMFGVGVSYQVSTLSYLEERSEKMKKHRPAVLAACLLIAYALSLFGFGDLIGFLYPIFGYFGVLLILLLALRYAGTFRRR